MSATERTQGEDFCKEVLGWSMRHQDVHELPLHAQHGEERAEMSDAQNDGQVTLPRISIDFKIPIWAVASAAFFALWGGVTMYFELRDVSAKVTNMQMTVEASRAATANLSAEQAFIKYRMDKIEQEKTK